MKSPSLRLFKQENHALAAPWHLDVGGGMRRYRLAFLQELQLLPQSEQERLWQVVHKAMVTTERGIDPLPQAITRQFPSTATEAYRYYGVDRA